MAFIPCRSVPGCHGPGPPGVHSAPGWEWGRTGQTRGTKWRAVPTVGPPLPGQPDPPRWSAVPTRGGPCSAGPSADPAGAGMRSQNTAARGLHPEGGRRWDRSLEATRSPRQPGPPTGRTGQARCLGAPVQEPRPLHRFSRSPDSGRGHLSEDGALTPEWRTHKLSQP